jgi:hypothetical protein
VDDKGESVVYLLDGTVAHRAVVHPGLREGDWIEVSGVTAGASVVVTGNAYLSDGAAVAVRAVDPT